MTSTAVDEDELARTIRVFPRHGDWLCVDLSGMIESFPDEPAAFDHAAALYTRELEQGRTTRLIISNTPLDGPSNAECAACAA